MAQSKLRILGELAFGVGVSFIAITAASHAQRAPISEKDARSAAQQKINSQLLYEIYRARGQAEQKGIPPESTSVTIDARGRALVDVRATPVTVALEKKIESLGGTIQAVAAEQRSVIAWLPVLKLEELAQDAAVRFIEPAAESTTNPSGRR